MSERRPTFEQLNAYLDGELTPEHQAYIDACMENDPALQEALAALSEQDRRLRVALNSVEHLPRNPRLDPAYLRRQLQQKKQRVLALCASFLLCFVVGAGGGWYTHKQLLMLQEPPMADAMETYRLVVLNGSEATGPKPLPALSQTDIDGWFNRHFSAVDAAPDWTRFGLRASHAQLVPTVDGPAALVVYQTSDGQEVMYFIRPPGRGLRKFLEDGEREEKGLLARYWSDQHFNYALVCQSDFSHRPLMQNLPLRL